MKLKTVTAAVPLALIACLFLSACSAPLVPKQAPKQITFEQASENAKKYLKSKGATQATLARVSQDDKYYFFVVKIAVSETSSVTRTIRVNRFNGKVGRADEVKDH